MEIPGPTLQDIKLRTQTSYEQLSQALSARSAGKFLGAVIVGFVVDKFPRSNELVIAISLAVGAVMAVLVPYTPYLALLGMNFLVTGTCEGSINVGEYDMILMYVRT